MRIVCKLNLNKSVRNGLPYDWYKGSKELIDKVTFKIQNSFISRRDSLTAWCAFTRLPVAKWFIRCQFASAQLNVRSRLLDSKLVRLEGSSLMSTVAEWLLCAHAATAPSINFVVDFWVLYCNRTHRWTEWLRGLLLR